MILVYRVIIIDTMISPKAIQPPLLIASGKPKTPVPAIRQLTI